MPASKDPRVYVRPVPLPIPSCKGVKLLARDVINFNPENPSREEVRKNNYNRRINQMSNMGFRSASHKPYVGIGDPFYLDERKMILHALGQWTEEHASSSSSSDDEDDEEDGKDAEPKPAFTAAKFVLRRSRKDLNTLNKAVVHGRNMIRNVSLGHGLFDLINKEKQHKKEASEEAIRKRREQLRNEFQPPKTESDDETDEDLDNDVDLTNYMVPVAPPTFLTQQQMDTDEELGIVNDNASESDQSPEREPEIITFSGMALAEDEEEYQRARSAMVTSQMTSSYSRPVSRRKKKQETPRPYTPQHTNLSANISLRESVTDSDQELDITRDALFRQLCVLHWILEAMSTDPPSPMTPIMSCWSLTDIGGSRAQPKKLQRDKATESGWASFLSKDTARVSKRLSTQRLGNRSPHVRRPIHPVGRNSVQSSATGSQQGSATERGPSPFGNAAIKRLLLSKQKADDPHVTSPVPEKLASLLKPKITMEMVKPLEQKEDSSAPLADPKLASLLKPKLSGEMIPVSSTPNNMSSLTKSPSPEGIDIPDCNYLQKQTPKLLSDTKADLPSKLGAFFKNKEIDGHQSESPTPPTSPLKSKQTDSHNEVNVGPQNSSKMAFQAVPKRSPSPSRMKSSLGAASCLGQFLELKMRGGLNQLTSQMAVLGTRNDDLSPRNEDEEDQMYNKSIFKFLDEYYESLKTEEEARKKNELETKSPSSTPPTTPVPDRQSKDKKDKSSKKKKKRSESEKRLDHKVAVALGEEEKMTSKYLRANAHLIKPKSSAALMDFQAGLPSSKKAGLCADLHNQFAECREEKALTLHDILDHKESQRMSVCQSKFVSLQGMRHGSSFHRAVEDMRTKSWQQLRKPVNDRKKSVAKGNWYTDLVEKIPQELKQEWFYSKILQKLGNFGLVEGTGKQSIYKFIKVLEGLREWEICSPDITAAVEFCRERIVEMTIEEYELWFTQRFPKITRPQTAPPATKTEKKGNSSASTIRRMVPKRPSQSAFTRRVQH